MAEVIMPALGMAQDTGKLVQWLKQPGDAVAVGDQLFEVETDKSVMEVEAQADGFLTQVSASDGEDVPVGQVIAMISATADNAVAAPAAAPAAAPEPAEGSVAVAASSAPTSTPSAPLQTGDRVLASPKARRLAAEQGLDLDVLVQAGHPQPYHVADLAVLRDIPASIGQAVVMAAIKQITARCARQGTRDFIDWMQTDGGVTVSPTTMLASFAAGAWREATEAAVVVVRLIGSEGPETNLRNPDFSRLSAAPPETEDAPSFVLHDLSDSVLTSLRLGDPNMPTLSIGADGDSYILTFDFGSDHLTDDQAIAFISGLARRLSDPLHHLV